MSWNSADGMAVSLKWQVGMPSGFTFFAKHWFRRAALAWPRWRWPGIDTGSW